MLLNLNKKVTELVAKTERLHVEILRSELESLINSSNKIKLIDKAIETLTAKYLNDCKILSGEIIKNLNSLKIQSYPDYLIAFKYTYDEIAKILFSGRFNPVDSTLSDFYDRRIEDTALYCIIKISNVLNTEVFKPLADSLIIDRSKDFNAVFNLPETFNELKEYIIKGLYEIELFINGKSKKIEYYDIPRAIEKFNSVRLLYENNPPQCLALMDKYFTVIFDLSNKIEHSYLANEEAFENEIFVKTYNELDNFTYYMRSLFTEEELEKLEPSSLNVFDTFNTNGIEEKNNTYTFDTILTKEKAIFVLAMLENMSITINGKSILSERRKGAIRGVVEALKENNILPELSLEISCNLIADKIGLKLKSKLDISETSEAFQKKANTYIKANYK